MRLEVADGQEEWRRVVLQIAQNLDGMIGRGAVGQCIVGDIGRLVGQAPDAVLLL